MDEEAFGDGFMFALFVTDAKSDGKSWDALANKLRDIVNGNLSLSPSPPDAIAAIEADAGKTLPDVLCASVHRMLGDRAELDAKNRERAQIILKMMGCTLD